MPKQLPLPPCADFIIAIIRHLRTAPRKNSVGHNGASIQRVATLAEEKYCFQEVRCALQRLLDDDKLVLIVNANYDTNRRPRRYFRYFRERKVPGGYLKISNICGFNENGQVRGPNAPGPAASRWDSAILYVQEDGLSKTALKHIDKDPPCSDSVADQILSSMAS